MTRIIGWSDDFEALNVPSLWEDYNPQGVGSISVSDSSLTISVPKNSVDRFRGLFSKKGLTYPEFEVLIKLRWNVPNGGSVEIQFNKDFERLVSANLNMYYFYYYGGYRYYCAKIINGAWKQLGLYDMLNNNPTDFEYWRIRYRRGLMVWDRSTISENGPWTRFARFIDRSLSPPFRLALVVMIRRDAPASSTSFLYVDWVKVMRLLPYSI